MSSTDDAFGITRAILSNHGGIEINSINNVMNSNNQQANDINDELISDPIPESLYHSIEQFNNFQMINKNKFRIMSINCQSLNSKYNELKFILDHCMDIGAPVHVLVLQETHIKDKTTACFGIDGYNFISQPAIINQSGGLAIYLHEDFSYEHVLGEVSSNIFESQFIKIKINKIHSITIGNIYRRPEDNYGNYLTFNEEISVILDKLSSGHGDVMLAGDFNINLLKIGIRPIFSEFLEIILSAGYLPQITLPTRYTNNNTFSLIDNFFTKLTATTSSQNSGILVSSISDHFGYFTALDLNLERKVKKYVKIRKETVANVTKCVNDLTNANLTEKILCNDFDNPCTNYDILQSEIIKTLNKNIPEQNVKFNKYKHFKDKWMTRGILNSIKYRDVLFVELKSMNNTHPLFEHQKQNLKTYNKLLKKLIRSAKRNYYNDYFQSNANNIKNTWKEINLLIGNKKSKSYPEFFIFQDKKLTSDFEIAQGFNKYFSEIGMSIAESMTPRNDASYKKYLSHPTNHRFNFRPVTEQKVLETLNHLNNKSSCGHDDISTNLLKRIFSPLLKPLTIIINQCIRTGIFPQKLKIAKLVPLYKKDDPHILGNYRPIALLPSISKIFEKILHFQVTEYFESNELFYSGQYGFRSGHSCELAALELIDRVSDRLVNRKDPFCIFLDLSKAFDILSHDILLDKLKYYGFEDLAVNLISSYLSNRRQYVVYNEVKSNLIDLLIGVPQGSIMGPLLFLIYVNDLHKSSNLFTFINFADDTTLLSNLQDFENISTPLESAKYINNEIKLVEEWLYTNKLSLNAKKTKAMFFKAINRKLTLPNLEISNTTIDIVKSFNFLGIIIDEKLKWNDHVHHTSIKISRANGILSRIKHFIPHKILLQIYNAIITPHLNYGNLLWGYNCAKVIKMQKKSIRIINDKKFNSHTEPLFKLSKVIKLNDLVFLRIMMFNYKLCNHQSPVYFNSFQQENQSQVHNHFTRGRNKPAPLRSLSNYQSNTLRFQLNKALISNSSHNIINFDGLSELSYKYKLKKFLLESYSLSCIIPNCYACNNS